MAGDAVLAAVDSDAGRPLLAVVVAVDCCPESKLAGDDGEVGILAQIHSRNSADKSGPAAEEEVGGRFGGCGRSQLAIQQVFPSLPSLDSRPLEDKLFGNADSVSIS